MFLHVQDCLYHHEIGRISFIAQDMGDSRAFGYIFGGPGTGYRFFGIKTDKASIQVISKRYSSFYITVDTELKGAVIHVLYTDILLKLQNYK